MKVSPPSKIGNDSGRLNLHGTKAGDTALEHIAGLTLLESLDVGSTLMTDVGLERLTSLTNLRALTMGGN